MRKKLGDIESELKILNKSVSIKNNWGYTNSGSINFSEFKRLIGVCGISVSGDTTRVFLTGLSISGTTVVISTHYPGLSNASATATTTFSIQAYGY